MTRGVFVTGTDTGVGKTLACCALIHALRAAGAKAVPMKPIAAGAAEVGGRRINEDTLALMHAAGLGPAAEADVTPLLLLEPMAPHVAAAREQRRIELEPIRAAFLRLRESGDFVVVEGVGGFVVPLDDDLDTVDLARMLGLPVLLVVGMRLGCLNHALLTARAIEASGLPFAGWIANHVDPRMAVPDENVAALRARLGAPLLGRLPFEASPDPVALARRLDVTALLHRNP
jgi:dethiobiotin synthetase